MTQEMAIFDDPKYPKNEHNQMPLYRARWIDDKGRTRGSTSGKSLIRAVEIALKHGGCVVRGYYGGFI